MSERTPRGYRRHHYQYDDVYWCECDERCSQGAVCDCCELFDLRDEVDRLTAALTDRDRRIEAVESVIEEHGWIEFDLIREALRGESDDDPDEGDSCMGGADG